MFIETRMVGAREIAAGLARVSRYIQTGSSTQIGRRLSREGLRVVVKLTPRQRNTQREGSTRRGFPPFHKQWRLIEQVQTENAYRAVIRNRAVETTEGLVALASVEFGAKAHTIAPRVASQLVWYQPSEQRMFQFRTSPRTGSTDPQLRVRDRFSRRQQDEGYVFAHVVQHPGMASFRMVQETKDHLGRLASVLLRQFAQEIRREFGQGFRIRIR
jgi:hypothetical protein